MLLCFLLLLAAGGRASALTLAQGSGANHACVQGLEGLFCWGSNGQGLGDYGRAQPVGPTAQVCVGWEHTCALLTNGSVTCWGYNAALGPPPQALDVACGTMSSCALLADHSVTCWGENLAGQPLAVEASSVSVGSNFACTVWSGQIRCWGENSAGQTDCPQQQHAVAVSCGGRHSCALLEDGSVTCWGWSLFEQLAVPVGLRATAVACGGFHTCALRTNGSVACWGYNETGQLGSSLDALQATSVSSGFQHSCAVLTDGRVVCWGDNYYGQLGPVSASSSFSAVPVAVPLPWAFVTVTQAAPEAQALVEVKLAQGSAAEHACALGPWGLTCWDANGLLQPPPIVVQQVCVGAKHTCAVLTDGSVTCWGSMVAPPLAAVQQVACGNDISCALLSDGEVVCWGGVTAAQLQGISVSVGSMVACAVRTDGQVLYGLGDQWTDTGVGSAVAVCCGGLHMCALLATGGVRCWDGNQEGQSDVPEGLLASAVSCGYWHTCALLTNSSVACWGSNNHGQLGLEEVQATSITCGHFHTCAVLTSGEVQCWGDITRVPSLPLITPVTIEVTSTTIVDVTSTTTVDTTAVPLVPGPPITTAFQLSFIVVVGYPELSDFSEELQLIYRQAAAVATGSGLDYRRVSLSLNPSSPIYIVFTISLDSAAQVDANSFTEARFLSALGGSNNVLYFNYPLLAKVCPPPPLGASPDGPEACSWHCPENRSSSYGSACNCNAGRCPVAPPPCVAGFDCPLGVVTCAEDTHFATDASMTVNFSLPVLEGENAYAAIDVWAPASSAYLEVRLRLEYDGTDFAVVESSVDEGAPGVFAGENFGYFAATRALSVASVFQVDLRLVNATLVVAYAISQRFPCLPCALAPARNSSALVTTPYQLHFSLHVVAAEEELQRLREGLAAVLGEGDSARVALFYRKQPEYLDVYYATVSLDDAARVDAADTTSARSALQALGLSVPSFATLQATCPPPPPGARSVRPGSCAFRCGEHMRADCTSCQAGFLSVQPSACGPEETVCPFPTLVRVTEYSVWSTRQDVTLRFFPPAAQASYWLSINVEMQGGSLPETIASEVLSFVGTDLAFAAYYADSVYDAPPEVAPNLFRGHALLYDKSTQTLSMLPSPRYHVLTVTVYAQDVDFNFSYAYARGAEAFECHASILQETTFANQTNITQQTFANQTFANQTFANQTFANETNSSIAQQSNKTIATEAYEVHFVATLAYSSPAAFTDALRVLYRKGVIAAVGGMDPEREYARVSLSVAAARRRLLQGTIAVATTVALDSQAAAASAAAAVNETSLRQAVAQYGMVLTAMTPPTWSTSPLTTPVVTPATASEEFPVLLVVALVAGVVLALLVVCACACLLHHRSLRVVDARRVRYSRQASDSDDE